MYECVTVKNVGVQVNVIITLLNNILYVRIMTIIIIIIKIYMY